MDFGTSPGHAEAGFPVEETVEDDFIKDFYRLSLKELVATYPERQREICDIVLKSHRKINELLDSLDAFDQLSEGFAKELIFRCGRSAFFQHLPKFLKGMKDQKSFFDSIHYSVSLDKLIVTLPLFSFDKKYLIEEMIYTYQYVLLAESVKYFPKELHPYIAEKLVENEYILPLLQNLPSFEGVDNKALSKQLVDLLTSDEYFRDALLIESELGKTIDHFDEIDPVLITYFRKRGVQRGIHHSIKMGFIEYPTREDFDILSPKYSAMKDFDFLAQYWNRFEGVSEREAFEVLYERCPKVLFAHLGRFPSYSVEDVLSRAQKDHLVEALGMNAHHFPEKYQNKLVENFLRSFSRDGYIIISHLGELHGLSAFVAKILLGDSAIAILGHLSSFLPEAINQSDLVDIFIVSHGIEYLFPLPKELTKISARDIVLKAEVKDLERTIVPFVHFFSREDQVWFANRLFASDREFLMYSLHFFSGLEIFPQSETLSPLEIQFILKNLSSFRDPREALSFYQEHIGNESHLFLYCRMKRLQDALMFLQLNEWELWLEQIDFDDQNDLKLKTEIERTLEALLPRLLKAGLPEDAKKIVALCKQYHLTIPEKMEADIEKAEVVFEERVLREIVDKPVDVLEDMTKFYTHQLIQIDLPTEKEKRDARLHGIDLPVRTWVDLNDMTRSFEAHERRIAHWMKNYAVYAIHHELEHQDGEYEGKDKENMVLLPRLELTPEQKHYQDQFTHPVDRFLAVATPTEIRRYLFQAEQRYSQDHWTPMYGGKAWVQICHVMTDIWREDSPLSIQIDCIFDLQHNSGCIFDKRPDRVQEDGKKIKSFLDFKFQASGNFEQWKIELRRCLDLDHSDCLIGLLEHFEKMRPRLEAFRDRVQK